MKFSVIIPAINEEASIGSALASAKGAYEVLVADGGSTDGTVERAERAGARVIKTLSGRGLQMDEAAAVSAGDVLLFLHADSRLPEGWEKAAERGLSEKGAIAGAFRLRIDSPKPLYRALEKMIRLRCRLFGFIYGDQAIFVRREAFLKAGGFRKLPLMEDIDCVKRLRRLGCVALLDEAALTSPRRWEQNGVLKNTLRNWALLSLYFAGVSPERLYGWYYPKNRVR